MFEVESDITIPPHRGRPTLYPWANMNVGDSFFVPDVPGRKRNRGISAANNRAFDPKIKEKYATRSVEGGVRIWRVK